MEESQPIRPALDDEGLAHAWLEQRRELRLLAEREPRPYVGFDSHQLAGESTGGLWDFAFRTELRDLVRQLINSLNEWRYILARLQAWEIVLERHDDRARIQLLLEFVHPLAENQLNMPYRIKQAMIFTAYRALDHLHRSEAPLNEEKINFKALNRRAAGRYSAEALMTALGELDSEALRKATANFRHRHHHGFPPDIEVGVLPTVRRLVREDGIGFGFGWLEPLTLRVILPEHEAELRRAVAAFEQLWALVRELDGELHKQGE